MCVYILYINICSLNPKPHCLNHVPFHGEAAETTLSCRLPKVRRPDRAVLIVYGLDVRRLTCQTLPNPLNPTWALDVVPFGGYTLITNLWDTTPKKEGHPGSR